ncbi:MAG: cob(I)yrinic acid a,c-diamide adenosyltransferase [Elusimicrobiota bacterium]|nr:cob(I)yrinic acid a,c-diamide adenosyltransferase [Elusimicrobiota bacterium]
MPRNFKPKQGSGDKGITDTITGKKIRKTDSRIKTIAAIDELTCLLGLLKPRFKKSSKLKPFIKEIEKIQNNLFIISGIIAGMKPLTEIKAETKNLEGEIDKLSKKTSQFNKFIVPGASETEAFIHLARTKARLAEIAIWDTKRFKTSAIFLNRLSDYLFLLALKAL